MDTPRVLLEHYLKQLRLPTIIREFPKLAEQCAKQGATFEQFLLRLVEQEMMDRERRATERRIKAAKFPVSKSLETYDFLAIPSLNKKLVVELARCEWIGRRENVLAFASQLEVTRRLVTLSCDVPIEFDLESSAVPGLRVDVRAFFAV